MFGYSTIQPARILERLAVGDQGLILNYTEKVGWTEMKSPTNAQLNDVDGSWAWVLVGQ
jgi:hypothetical protein